MSRPFILLALVLAVMGAVFLLANFGGGSVALYLLVASIILTNVGILTGK